jgi:hypothetical protein
MALATDKKLYISLGVLVVLGGLLFIQRREAAEEASGYTLAGRTADLPKIQVSEDQTKKIDRIAVMQPAGDAGKATQIELKKAGENWKLVKPFEAKANDANVKSLLDNLKSLEVTERIDSSKDAYASYDLTDAKAVHAVFYVGEKPAHEFWFGQSGSRGQMSRLAGKEGVYAVKGYSSYLYSRDVKGWRDLSLLKFEEADVTRVEIENEQGAFVFEKSSKPADKAKEKEKADAGAKEEAASWVGKFKKKKTPTAKAIDKFEPSKVDDMVRAFKALNATDFTRDKKEADVGLDEPNAVITFTLKDGAKRVLKVGDTSEGSSRWVKRPEDTELYSISSWAADWATAEPKKFEKLDEKEKAKQAADQAHGMPGMPGGHPPMMGAE